MSRPPTEVENKLRAMASGYPGSYGAQPPPPPSPYGPPGAMMASYPPPPAIARPPPPPPSSSRENRFSRSDEPPRKRSRFSTTGTKYFVPGIPHLLPHSMPREALDALLLRVRIDEITNCLTTGNLGLEDENVRRSPSPPPRYDNQGKRTNTREQRTKEKMQLERQNLIQAAQQLNPLFKPPSDYRPINVKKTAKIRIPVDKYPDYNFIGLIIGPRGDTHKQLERKSGAKISIRGKGSQKEGQMGKNPDDDEDLHVLVTADTQKQLEKAVEEVEKLLVPIADEVNEHKQLQLRKLADYNGTLRENNWNSGPKRFQPDVVCGFCGEPSHPTSDCPMKKVPGAKSKIDQEYESFLSAIGEAPKVGGAPAPSAAPTDSYEEFMASIGQAAPPPPPPGYQPPPPAPYGGNFGYGYGYAQPPAPPPMGSRPPWQNH